MVFKKMLFVFLITTCSVSTQALEVTKEVCTDILMELGLSTASYKFKDGWVTKKHIFDGSVECYRKKGHVFISSGGEVLAEHGFFGKDAVAARAAVLSLYAKDKSELKVKLGQQIEEARNAHKLLASDLEAKAQAQLERIRKNKIPDSIASAVALDIAAKKSRDVARQKASDERAERRAIKKAEKKAKKERQAAEQAAKKERKEAVEKLESIVNKMKGRHCLSGWDGSHRQVVSSVKKALNDPSSFDHESTQVGPIKDGKHQFQMIYRAKNGFGALVKSSVTGFYNNDDCNVASIAKGG